MKEYILLLDVFYRHKSQLDGYVFYIIKDNYAIIRQVIPYKSIKSLLNSLQIN